jgi:hypothetical protein
MTLMPHSIFEHYIEERFQVNFRRIRVPAHLVCPDERTSRDAVIRPDVRCRVQKRKWRFHVISALPQKLAYVDPHKVDLSRAPGAQAYIPEGLCGA